MSLSHSKTKKVTTTATFFLFLASAYAIIFQVPIYTLGILPVAFFILITTGTLAIVWRIAK